MKTIEIPQPPVRHTYYTGGDVFEVGSIGSKAVLVQCDRNTYVLITLDGVARDFNRWSSSVVADSNHGITEDELQQLKGRSIHGITYLGAFHDLYQEVESDIPF